MAGNVHTIYYELLKQGYDKKNAAKEAQARTGMNARTGRPIRKVRNTEIITGKRDFIGLHPPK